MIYAKSNWACSVLIFSLCLASGLLHAQSTQPANTVPPETTQTLQVRVTQLESEVTELKNLVRQMCLGSA